MTRSLQPTSPAYFVAGIAWLHRLRRRQRRKIRCSCPPSLDQKLTFHKCKLRLRTNLHNRRSTPLTVARSPSATLDGDMGGLRLPCWSWEAACRGFLGTPEGTIPPLPLQSPRRPRQDSMTRPEPCSRHPVIPWQCCRSRTSAATRNKNTF